MVEVAQAQRHGPRFDDPSGMVSAVSRLFVAQVTDQLQFQHVERDPPAKTQQFGRNFMINRFGQHAHTRLVRPYRMMLFFVKTVDVETGFMARY
jgi:hypothetical protein